MHGRATQSPQESCRGAKSKPLGDAWAWSRKESTGDAALVVAMTPALHAGVEIPADAGDSVIY